MGVLYLQQQCYIFKNIQLQVYLYTSEAKINDWCSVKLKKNSQSYFILILLFDYISIYIT